MQAIEARELLLTVQAAYVHPTAPSNYLDSYAGSGFHASIEKVLDASNSLGVMVSTAGFRNPAGDQAGASFIDVVGRHFWRSERWLNPYVLGGLGANLFATGTEHPFGDVLHAQLALGSIFVLGKYWALDYAAAYHFIAPLSQPYSFAELRLGLSYRFGAQARVNFNAAPSHLASPIEVISDESVERIIGHYGYDVQVGDSLYKIAGLKLGNPQLWPLLADENRQMVRDPQLIFPKQKLEIKRHYPEAKKKAAIHEAWIAPDPKPKDLSATTQAQH